MCHLLPVEKKQRKKQANKNNNSYKLSKAVLRKNMGPLNEI